MDDSPYIDPDRTGRARLEQMLQERAEEENHYARLARLFGSADGFALLQWLMDITGYWEPGLHDERAVARYELGRLIFNQASLADLAVINRLLDVRREEKLKQLEAEKRQIKHLYDVKSKRDEAAVKNSLARIREVAQKKVSGEDENIVPAMIDAVRVYASVGEIFSVLRETFGEFRLQKIF